MKEAGDEANTTKDNPLIYSKVVPELSLSIPFLRINGTNTVPKEEKKPLPDTPPLTFLTDEGINFLQLANKKEIFKHFSLIGDKNTSTRNIRMV